MTPFRLFINKDIQFFFLNWMNVLEVKIKIRTSVVLRMALELKSKLILSIWI